MSTIKIVLLVLATTVAYGVVGTMDYEDAVRAEHAYAQRASEDCPKPDTESSSRDFRNVRSGPVEVAAGALTIDPCDHQHESGARHVDLH